MLAEVLSILFKELCFCWNILYFVSFGVKTCEIHWFFWSTVPPLTTWPLKWLLKFVFELLLVFRLSRLVPFLLHRWHMRRASQFVSRLLHSFRFILHCILNTLRIVLLSVDILWLQASPSFIVAMVPVVPFMRGKKRSLPSHWVCSEQTTLLWELHL